MKLPARCPAYSRSRLALHHATLRRCHWPASAPGALLRPFLEPPHLSTLAKLLAKLRRFNCLLLGHLRLIVLRKQSIPSPARHFVLLHRRATDDNTCYVVVRTAAAARTDCIACCFTPGTLLPTMNTSGRTTQSCCLAFPCPVPFLPFISRKCPACPVPCHAMPSVISHAIHLLEHPRPCFVPCSGKTHPTPC